MSSKSSSADSGIIYARWSRAAFGSSRRNVMKPGIEPARRRFFRFAFGATATLLLAGCEKLSQTGCFLNPRGAGERLNEKVHGALGGRGARAQEFPPADLSPDFRSNGTSDPDNPQYQAMVANEFADYQLRVEGLVDKPAAFS